MNAQLEQVERRLEDSLAASERGPRRNGLFALWLVVRQCAGVVPPDAVAPALARRRLERLERRLSSLSLPAPLRRALPATVRELAGGHPESAAVALQQLIAPAREALGGTAAEALALAARATRVVVRAGPPAEATR
ncbi:MAG: hypothetical protein PVF27_07345 [Gemmatimonadales bacterium]|jgi:hypothetical protein